jgi:N-carbamoylputrescine amidase
MKIALIQQHATGNRQENLSRGIKAVEEAAQRGAQLVAFAELAFDRFLPQRPVAKDYLAHAEPVPGPTTELLSLKAKELGVVIVLNMYEREGEKAYDCSPVIDSNGRIVGKTRMIHIIDAPLFHEKGYYTPGDLGAGVFDTAAGRIGVAICYDRHFPEYMRALALKGAELVIIPQAGGVGEWPQGIFEAEVQIAAFQNGYFAALVNRVGTEDHVAFTGESFISDPEGQVISRAPSGSDHVLYADIDLGRVKTCTAKKHFIPDRRPETYSSL